MARNRITKKKKNNLKVITAFAIIAIFAIVLIYNIIALFINPTDTFMIENGKIESEEEAVGYLIREEKLFLGQNYKNGISQIKTEGQRVAKGEPIFRYYTNNEENLTQKIAELDLQIQDALEQSTNIYSSDIASIDKQIEEKLLKIATFNKTNNMKEYKNEINSALTKKARLTGELSPSGSYIKDLISKRSKYEEQLNSGSEYVKATVSGLVSYKIDGLEEVLTIDGLENLTEEYLNNLKLKTGEMIASSNEKGKIVNNYYCYIATVLKSDEAKNASINQKVQLELSTGNEVKATIQNIKKQESGNVLIVFKITDGVEKLVNYRKIMIEVIWWKATGLRVPNSSIITKDEKNYIIRKRAGFTDQIMIKVLKKAENNSIIANYTSSELKEMGYSTEEIRNMKNITLYDEIILNPTK